MKHSRNPTRSLLQKKRVILPAVLLVFCSLLYGWNAMTPVSAGLAFEGPMRPVQDLDFLADVSWQDEAGKRHVRQEIFDHVMRVIGNARRLILIDMFLYNDFQGPTPETTRAVSEELTAALIDQKKRHPQMRVVVITDPINIVYGGARSPQFDRLQAAGVEVVITDLAELRDSNPVYSFIWRTLIKPWGNTHGDTLPNPFGAGRVTVRSYLRMINFKANHRKILLADTHLGSYTALVTSANPHDGSSAHRNVALAFSGPAAIDIVQAENAVLQLADNAPLNRPELIDFDDQFELGVTLQLLTEGGIKRKLLSLINHAINGTQLDLLMFYLSDRDVITALIAASRRGARVRVILDVNRDAFGREKNGVPNKPVAAELRSNGINVRWCDTSGEQCHAKMLLMTTDVERYLLQGSANFTRRNLDNFNLETDVLVTGDINTTAISDAQSHFNRMWTNEPGKSFTVDYEIHQDTSIIKRWLYRGMEATGISTF